MSRVSHSAGWLCALLCSSTASLCRPALIAQAPPPARIPNAQADTGPRALLTQARSFFNSGQYDHAKQLALQYLAQFADSSEAMYLVAHSYEREKKPKESLAWFTRAAAIAPPSAEDLRSVALNYVLLDDYPDATHWLQRAVTADPRDAEAWYDLGRALMTEGDAGAAEKSLETALQLAPQLVKAENNLGVVYETENRVEDAIGAYRTAIAWQSATQQPSEQPLLNLGTLLVTQQRGKEAVTLLQQAAAIAPDSVKAHEQLAHALEQDTGPGQALTEMQRAVQLDATNPRLHFELGQMYKRAGKLEQAAEELRRSRELYGSHSTNPDR